MRSGEIPPALREMAETMGVPLYRRYTEAQAAEIIGVSVPTLKRQRAAGKLSYLRLSERRIAFFGFQILNYLMEAIENEPCPDTKQTKSSKSVNTGSPSKNAPTPGAAPGTTKPLDRRAVLASAQRTFSKPKKP